MDEQGDFLQFLVVSRDSIRGCVSLYECIGPSIRSFVGPSVRNLFFSGQKQRKAYGVHSFFYKDQEKRFEPGK